MTNPPVSPGHLFLVRIPAGGLALVTRGLYLTLFRASVCASWHLLDPLSLQSALNPSITAVTWLGGSSLLLLSPSSAVSWGGGLVGAGWGESSDDSPSLYTLGSSPLFSVSTGVGMLSNLNTQKQVQVFKWQVQKYIMVK